MRSLPSLLVVLLLFVAVAISAPTTDGSTDNDQIGSPNIIQQIIATLAYRHDMKQVIDYLKKSEEDLTKQLPTLNTGIYLSPLPHFLYLLNHSQLCF